MGAPAATLDAPVTTLAVNTGDNVNAVAVPAAALATDTATLQADPANGVVTTTSFDEGSAAMTRGSFSAMPSGPMGGWFGGKAGSREPVRFSMAPGQPADGTTVHFGGVGSMSEPSEALRQDFEKLQTDLQAIQDKSEVTPKLLAAVRNDFDAIQKAATTDPDQEALKTLAATVESLDGQIPTDEQRAQLVADFTAVLKSQGVTDQTLIDTAVADIQAVVAASHVTADDLATIAADRDAIEQELKADAGATLPAMPSTGDAVGRLFAGLTGGIETGTPMAPPFVGGGPGGPFSSFPIDFTAAGGVMMDGGGQFDGSPISVSPSGGEMSGPVIVSHGGVMMDGGSQSGSFRVSSTRGIDASDPFSGSPAIVSYAGGEMGGKFGGRWGR